MDNTLYEKSMEQRNAIAEKIKEYGKGAPQRWMTIAASAVAGNTAAKSKIESTFGLEIKSMLDLYNVMCAASSLMSRTELTADAAESKNVRADPAGEADEYLANRLQQYREAAGMTQEQLARKSGVVLGTISKMENGKVNLLKAQSANVLRIAHALGVTVEDLIG